jgi:hypothetical protein
MASYRYRGHREGIGQRLEDSIVTSLSFIDIIGAVVASTLGVVLLLPPLIAGLVKIVRRMFNKE